MTVWQAPETMKDVLKCPKANIRMGDLATQLSQDLDEWDLACLVKLLQHELENKALTFHYRS